jgi:hypothetical protein
MVCFLVGRHLQTHSQPGTLLKTFTPDFPILEFRIKVKHNGGEERDAVGCESPYARQSESQPVDFFIA